MRQTSPLQTSHPRWRARAGAALMAAIIAALPAAQASGAAARGDSAIYDLQIRGIKAGTLSIAGAVDAGNYVATGRLQSSGVLSWIRKIRYDARAAGRLSGSRHFTPARYEETADTGRRQSEALMEYRAGVPQVKVYNPPRKRKDGGVDPAAQAGSVDPMTAAFAVLRDIPAAEACQLDLKLFDGKRASRVIVTDPRPSGTGLVCSGEYRRVDGFSAEDMAEKTSFPFTVVYAPGPDGLMTVDEVSMDTLYGKGRLKRR